MLYQDEKYIKLENDFSETESFAHSPNNEFSEHSEKDISKKLYENENSQKCNCRKPIVTCRGRSKGGLEEPILKSEVNLDNELFLKAEHGNYGEDAFFIVQTKLYLIFGIADGVGGWRKHGIDPSIFSASLVKHACRNSMKFVEMAEQSNHSECKKYISALDVMQAAYNDLLKYDGDKAYGSSTACFGVYDIINKELNIANLGDSGIYIRTSSNFEFLSSQMQHYYSCPFQLTNLPIYERGNVKKMDFPNDATLHNFQLSDGDYFIVGSDGLWDNIDIQNMNTNLDFDSYDIENCLNNNKRKQMMTEAFANNFFYEVVANSRWFIDFERLINYMQPNIANHGKYYGAKNDDISMIIVMV